MTEPTQGTLEQVQEMSELINQALVDAEKFGEKSNDAAGTRLRKTMQLLKGKAQLVRQQVSDTRKQRQ